MMRLPYWREDLQAAIVGFLLAIPLSIGVALIAGVPYGQAAGVGLSSSILGSAMSALSGSPLQIIGPSNGAAVLFLTIKDELGAGTVGLAVAFSGLMQVAAGGLGLGPLFRAVSPALVKGMLGGVGLLILTSQSYVMLDSASPGAGKEFGGILNILSLPGTLLASFTQPDRLGASILGLGTLVTIVLWDRYSRASQHVPSALIGILFGVLANSFVSLDPRRFSAPEHLLDNISTPSASDLVSLSHASFWVAAASFAFVGSVKTLLSSVALERMAHERARGDYSRDLVAQGVGNIACGLLGLLPLAGIVIRGSTNVIAGAKTRLAGVLQGIFILLLVLSRPQAFSLIPVASLAAVLVHAGARLIDPGFLVRLWREDRFEVCVLAITMTLVFTTDVLTGISIGITLSVVRLFYVLSRLEVTLERREDFVCVRLKGAATFLRLPMLIDALDAIQPRERVKIDLDAVSFIDHACLDTIANWSRRHVASGGVVEQVPGVTNGF